LLEREYTLTGIRLVIVVSLLYGDRKIDFVELHQLRPFFRREYAVPVTIESSSGAVPGREPESVARAKLLISITACGRCAQRKRERERGRERGEGRGKRERGSRDRAGDVLARWNLRFSNNGVGSVMLFASPPLIIPQIRNFLPCHDSGFLPLQLFARSWRGS